MLPQGKECWVSCRMSAVDSYSDTLYNGIDYDKLAKEFYDATLGMVGTDSNKVYETVIKAVGIPLRRGYVETTYCTDGCGSLEKTKLYKAPDRDRIAKIIRDGGIERLGKALERYVSGYNNCDWDGKKYECKGSMLVSQIIFDEMFGDDRMVLGRFSGIADWYRWMGIDCEDFPYASNSLFGKLDRPGADNEDCMTWVTDDKLRSGTIQETLEDIKAAEEVCMSIK